MKVLFLPFFLSSSHHSSPSFVTFCTGWTCTCSLSACPLYSNEDSLASTACIPAFILGSELQRQACVAAQGGKGSLPQWFIWTFPLFEMASQRLCMINVTTLIYTVLPRVPAEYLKTRNFSECPWAGPGVFDWQSVCYSAFSIIYVMSCTQVNTPPK